MSFLDKPFNPFNHKPGYTFRDFIRGADHRCAKCKTYVHRDDYDSNLKICDNCGILHDLRKELKKTTKPSTEN